MERSDWPTGSVVLFGVAMASAVAAGLAGLMDGWMGTRLTDRFDFDLASELDGGDC